MHTQQAASPLPAPIEPVPVPVPLDDAIAWTDNWRGSAHTLKANSFLFPLDDFQAVLKEPGVVSVRMYLGLKLNETNTIQEKMLCVGVDAEGHDIIPSKPRHISADEPEDGNTGIYDFSHPCPPLCSTGGSLLGGGDI